MNVEPFILEMMVPYLDLRTMSRLREICKGFRETLDTQGPRNLSLSRQLLNSVHPHGCAQVFERWGAFISSLSLLRCPAQSPGTIPSLLGITKRLRRLHLTDPEPASWDGLAVSRAIFSITSLEELRLHSTDVLGYDLSPFTPLLLALGDIPAEELSWAAPSSSGMQGASAHSTTEGPPQPVHSIAAMSGGGAGAERGGGWVGVGSKEGGEEGEMEAPVGAPPLKKTHRPLPKLRKLSIFTRLTSEGTAALVRFLVHPARRSRYLIKLKLSTSLVSSPGGGEVLLALGAHPAIKKFTLMRPEGMGEPVRKIHCQALAQAMQASKTLYSVHIRRAGMWTDTLQALTPHGPCPNITCLKLDSNSLAYLSASFFNEALDSLLARLPSLRALHLGNNQLDTAQAVGLAASITRHKLPHLTSLTLGSNDIGDTGLAAVLRSLPTTMEQLYLHGTQITDEGVKHVRDALLRLPKLWGVGLNGNPVSDSGVVTLCEGLVGRSSLQDVGVTLSDMTDEGCKQLGAALATCPSLRFVYLYSTGFKAATKVTETGKEELRKRLPVYCTPALDHRLSRYLKTKS